MVADFLLSGFADEIDPSLDAQIATLKRLSIPGLDLRSVDGTNVLDLSTDQLVQINDKCKAEGIHVQCIGSPVNKIDYDVLLQGRELDRLDKAIKAANLVNTRRIRVFSPRAPQGKEDEFPGRILSWLQEQKARCEREGITLLLENDDTYWNAYPETAKKMFVALGGPNFKAAFDFSNTVLIGFRPMRDWFPWLLPHLDTLHIKDAIESEHRIVPAGGGDGQIEETLRWLIEQGWSGPLTLEPHLSAAGPLGGFSGAQLFEEATNALRRILERVGVAA